MLIPAASGLASSILFLRRISGLLSRLGDDLNDKLGNVRACPHDVPGAAVAARRTGNLASADAAAEQAGAEVLVLGRAGGIGHPLGVGEDVLGPKPGRVSI